MDVGGWLRGLGLEQYEPAFRDNAIDGEVLPRLTSDDLKEIGVAQVGHRRKLLDAIAALGAPAAAPTPPAEAPHQSPKAGSAVAAAPSGGERRHLTVMFCDLVGSTEIAGRLDAEEWRDIVADYHRAVAEAVTRFGGHVAKNLGDGALVYFGYPLAQENDTERAVRAGLAILEAIAAQSRGLTARGGPMLAVRVGIHAGPVVIGEDAELYGEVPNIAARVQAAAGPGMVLISRDVHRLVSGLFVANERGTQTLKGVAEPVGLFQVMRASGAGRRHAVGRVNTPLIGREEELRQVESRWARARAGQGQLVLLVGEAGLGKSRLTEEFQSRLAEVPHTWTELACSQLLQNTPFHPFIEFVKRRLEEQEPTPEGRVAALAAWHRAVALDPAQSVPLVAPLLELPVPADYPPPPSASEERRRRLIATLAGWITGGARTQAILLLVEDVQWADPSTLDLLRVLAEQGAAVPLMLLVTSRPEFRAPWPHRSHHTVIALAPLERREVLRMLGEVAARHALSGEMLEALVTRTGGVPLFIEEVTRLLLEGGGHGGTQSIPLTLQASLTARLDRLGSAKEVAQIAAVLGREFAYPLIQAVARLGDAMLTGALERLAEADLIHAQGLPPDSTYRFKHALVQDAAYGALLKSRRRDWHERVARALEDKFPEMAANEPELLAHHFAEAGLAGPACDHRMRAGDRAMSRSAYKEAIANFSAGLKAADAVPEPKERMRRQLDFLLKLGAALTVVRGAQSTEVEDAYRRADDLGEALGDGTASYKAKWGLWLNANLGRKTALARDRARELVTLAQRSGDEDLLLEAYHCRWSTAFFRGDVAAALADSRIGAESYDQTRHRHLGQAFGGHDPGVCAHVVSAITLQQSDDRALAAESIARAIALAETLDHPNSMAHALTNVGMCHQIVADREATFAITRRLVALAEKYDLLPQRATGLLLSSWATAIGSGITDAARLIDAEIDKATAVGPAPQYYLGLAGEVLLAAGRPADGLALLDRALAAMDEPGVGFYLPEIHRLRGACLLALGRDNKDEARQAFMAARDVAIRQGAVIFERRAAAYLGDIANVRSVG
ncbi:MAG: AAA family ATPase [Alphaproteobacteria bacterium]